MAEIKFHPLADIFPLLEGPKLHELARDIAENGLREPIQLHEGKILDGRNRYLAWTQVLGRKSPPKSEQYEGSDPLAFVVSLNLHRRHLNESQRAMVAARIANMGRGRPEENPSIEGIKQPDAAKLLNVGKASVERAKAVQREAADESKSEQHRKAAASLTKMVESGDLAVSAAERVCRLSPDEFVEAVNGGAESVRAAAKTALRPSDKIAVAGYQDWPNSKAHYAAARAIEALAEIRLSPEEFAETMHDMVRRRFQNTARVSTWLAAVARFLDDEERAAAKSA